MTISPSKLFSTGLLSLAFLFSNSAFAAIEAVIDSPEHATEGTSVEFDGSRSHGQTLTYDWDVDGIVSLNLGPKNIISQGFTVGEHKIKLTVTNLNNESATAVKIITVLPINSLTAPQSSFIITDGVLSNIVDPKTLKVGVPYTFVSTSIISDILTSNYYWDFGDSINIGNPGFTKIFHNGTGYTTPSANTELKTMTYTFSGPSAPNKPFVITLASQIKYNDSGNRALTGTYSTEVTVTGSPAVNKTPIAERYKNECSECHGSVIAGALPSDPKQVINNKHSNLANRLTPKIIQVPGGTTVTLNAITEQRIADSYTSTIKVKPSNLMPATYMDGITPRLTVAARDAKLMESYLDILVPFIGDRTGEQIYLDQCSGCHGAGTGGYASDLSNIRLSAAEWKIWILELIDPTTGVNDMKSIPIRTVDLDKLAILLAGMQPGVNVIPKPQDGNALYTMYCTYCHGANGAGGPLSTDEPIKGVGVSVSSIIEEIDESDGSNGMEKLKGKLTLDEIKLIQKTL